MSNMVTRCPKCATSFRITSGQLKSANGAVRCGSCLHIFQAQDYFVSSAAPVAIEKYSAVVTPDVGTLEAARPPRTPPVKSAPKAHATLQNTNPAQDKNLSSPPVEKHPQALSETSPQQQPRLVAEAQKPSVISPSQGGMIGIDDDFLISDDMEPIDDIGQDTEESTSTRRAPQTVSLFERPIHTPDEDEEQLDPDESWAMHLLDEAESEMDHQSSHDSEIDQNELDADKDSDVDMLSEGSQPTDDQQDAPEQTAENPSESAEPPLYAVREPLFSLVDESSSTDEDPAETSDSLPEKTSKRPNDSRLRAYDSSRAALLMNISPEPLVMTSQHKRRWHKKPLWFLLGGLMVIALIVQIGWLQFSTLSRLEPYRSAYAVVCPWLGCKLPDLVDRQKIRTYNLVVRNHPHAKDVLIVDAIILNTAAFGQPFPDLALAFSTIDDQLVATRRFAPNEYLDGELAGKRVMPPNQPIHLTLELADPGPDAVNYHVYIPE